MQGGAEAGVAATGLALLGYSHAKEQLIAAGHGSRAGRENGRRPGDRDLHGAH